MAKVEKVVGLYRFEEQPFVVALENILIVYHQKLSRKWDLYKNLRILPCVAIWWTWQSVL